MSQNTIQKRIILPLVRLLKQGVDPSRLALAIASGSVVGVFPILGIATIICMGIAALYRLNLPVIQLASYLVFPMQIILFFPFLYIGEVLTGNSLDEISKAKLLETFDMGFLTAIQELTQYFILASIGWAFSLAPLFAILYFVFKKLITLRLQPKCE